MAETPTTIPVTVDVKLMLEGVAELVASDPTFSATAFCCVCCSTIDVIGTGLQTLDCSHCGQMQWVVIDPERFHKFSAV